MQVHLRLLDPADAPTKAGGGPVLLSAVTPNPSRGALSYTLRLEHAGRVMVEVIDVTGRVVARQADLDLAAGVHPLRWNASESATRLPSGIYFLRASTPDGRQSQLFVLTK